VAGGAVGERAHDAAAEVAASVVAAFKAGKHLRLIMGREVGVEEPDEERRQSDGAGGLGGLGRTEFQAAAGLEEGPDVGVDDEPPDIPVPLRSVIPVCGGGDAAGGVQVQVVPVQAGEFAPAGAGPGGGDE
jgi:hypothetical protein